MRRHFSTFILALLLACANVSAVAASSTPTERVQGAVDQILQVLADQSLNWQQRHDRIAEVVDRVFDFRSMSQSVLATNWQRASASERDQFVRFFSDYLESTYMEKLKNYSNEYVSYTGESIRGDRAVVDTEIIGDGKRIPVSYRMRLNEGEWFAYDVVIEDISLVNNYRNIYYGVIQRQGLTGLIDQLELKLQEQKARNTKPSS